MQEGVRDLRPRDFIRVWAPSTPRERLLLAVSEIADRHEVELHEVLGLTRRRNVVNARHEAMSALHDQGMTYPQIGRFFGRDHTTVMHGVKRWRGSGR